MANVLEVVQDVTEKLEQQDIDVGFKTGVSGAMVEMISGAIKAFFPVVFFVVNIGFSFILTLIHSTFVLLLKKVRVDFAIDETFFTNNTTQFGKIIDAFRETMTKIALMVIILVVMWQLFKSLFSYMNLETDDAVKLAGRAIIFSIMIFYSHDIIVWIINKCYSPMVDRMFGLLYDAKVMGITKNMTLSKMINIILNNVASSLRVDKVAIESLGSFAGLIQGLILIYIDFNVLIVLAKFAERTVVFLLLIIISPIAMACGVSKNTKHIFEGWLKSFAGVLVTYMLYNLILIMVILFMFLQSGGTVVIGGNAYRFIGNTSFVYATGIILGIFALMDQVETIARELGFNTGGVTISVGSSLGAIERTKEVFINDGVLALGAFRGVKVIGKYGLVKPIKYGLVKPVKYVDERLARRNMEKYERALNDRDRYNAILQANPDEGVRGRNSIRPFRKKNNSEKLKAAEKKIKGLEGKKYVSQFNEFMAGDNIGEKLKTLGGTNKLAKRLNELKKENDVKKEIADIKSRIQSNQDKIKELESKKGSVKEIAKLKAEIQMDKDRIVVTKNRILKINDANIKSFDKKVKNIDKLLQKNEEILEFANNEDRIKLNKKSQDLRAKKEFYKNRIDQIEKIKSEYIAEFGDNPKGYFYNKSVGEKIKSMPGYVAHEFKSGFKALGRASSYTEEIEKTTRYAIKSGWKGTKTLLGRGFDGGDNKLLRELKKETEKGIDSFKNWYQDVGSEKIKMFNEEVKYVGGKTMHGAMLPITLHMDVINNLVVKPTKGVWNKIAGSKNGEIRVSTIAKDMITPSISENMMQSDISVGYGRFKNIADTVEGNLVLNYRDVTSRKERLEDKLNNLERREGESDLSYQSKVEKLQNDIKRENKKMEKQQEQARMRMLKYETQREDLKERINQKTKEFEATRSSNRETLKETNPKAYNEYIKQETEISRMTNKLNRLNEKINVLQEITDGNSSAGVKYKLSGSRDVDVNVLKKSGQVEIKNEDSINMYGESPVGTTSEADTESKKIRPREPKKNVMDDNTNIKSQSESPKNTVSPSTSSESYANENVVTPSGSSKNTGNVANHTTVNKNTVNPGTSNNNVSNNHISNQSIENENTENIGNGMAEDTKVDENSNKPREHKKSTKNADEVEVTNENVVTPSGSNESYANENVVTLSGSNESYANENVITPNGSSESYTNENVVKPNGSSESYTNENVVTPSGSNESDINQNVVKPNGPNESDTNVVNPTTVNKNTVNPKTSRNIEPGKNKAIGDKKNAKYYDETLDQ